MKLKTELKPARDKDLRSLHVQIDPGSGNKRFERRTPCKQAPHAHAHPYKMKPENELKPARGKGLRNYHV